MGVATVCAREVWRVERNGGREEGFFGKIVREKRVQNDDDESAANHKKKKTCSESSDLIPKSTNSATTKFPHRPQPPLVFCVRADVRESKKNNSADDKVQGAFFFFRPIFCHTLQTEKREGREGGLIYEVHVEGVCEALFVLARDARLVRNCGSSSPATSSTIPPRSSAAVHHCRAEGRRKKNKPKSCLTAFKVNNFSGLVLFLGIFLR